MANRASSTCTAPAAGRTKTNTPRGCCRSLTSACTRSSTHHYTLTLHAGAASPPPGLTSPATQRHTHKALYSYTKHFKTATSRFYMTAPASAAAPLPMSRIRDRLHATEKRRPAPRSALLLRRGLSPHSIMREKATLSRASSSAATALRRSLHTAARRRHCMLTPPSACRSQLS